MPAFRSTDALEAVLRDAGLDAWVGRVVATARPSILFRREQVPDAALPLGASKLGGAPTLPAGFRWPTRPAHPDAARLAARERQSGATRRDLLAQTREERLARPLQPGERAIELAELDAATARSEFVAGCFARPFPLAFVAQLNLADLSGQAGFDPHLPPTGTLSIFCDATECEPKAVYVAWSDELGTRHDAPADLVDYYTATCADTIGPWQALTQAEALVPFSAVDIPDHWRAHGVVGPWLDACSTYRPPGADGGGNNASFGDRLGGWAADIQGNPEDELQDGSRIHRPGDTPWRHLFSWGGEYWGGTRLVPIEGLYDGNAFVMMTEHDLAGARFGQARLVMQFT